MWPNAHDQPEKKSSPKNMSTRKVLAQKNCSLKKYQLEKAKGNI